MRFEEKSVVRFVVGFVLFAVFVAVFGAPAYAQFARMTGSAGWGYGYGYGYGYGFGFDGGGGTGYKTDFATSAADVLGYGYGYGYLGTGSGGGSLYDATDARYEATPSDITELFTGGVIIPNGSSPASTTYVTFTQPVLMTIGNTTITIPANTRFTANSTTSFSVLTGSESVTTSDLPSNVSSVGAVQFGLPSLGVTLSQAVTITINVGSSYNGQALTVYHKTPGGSWSSLSTCTVSSGVCSFTTTQLSDFAATRTSGGGGGGGGTVIMGDASVVINDNAYATKTREVTLKLRATGATQMMVSNLNTFEGAEWEPFAATKAWTLTEEEGLKTVYVKYKNAANRVSYVASDTIMFSTTATAEETTGVVSGTTATPFTLQMKLGMQGDEISRLQTFLKQYPEIYPEGLVTGYYGSLTKKAVERFQEKYGIAKAGDPGYGEVGPKTRAKINELMGAGTGVQTQAQAQIRTLQEQVLSLLLKLVAMLQAQLAALGTTE